MTYVLLPRARRDLIEIWDYTDRVWGAPQADQYIREVNAVFVGLAEGRVVTLPVGVGRQGYRKALCGQHVVFFRDGEGTVEIVRVLHQRMDFEGKV